MSLVRHQQLIKFVVTAVTGALLWVSLFAVPLAGAVTKRATLPGASDVRGVWAVYGIKRRPDCGKVGQ